MTMSFAKIRFDQPANCPKPFAQKSVPAPLSVSDEIGQTSYNASGLTWGKWPQCGLQQSRNKANQV
eukprot:2818265-Amphidinium_carterae.1